MDAQGIGVLEQRARLASFATWAVIATSAALMLIELGQGFGVIDVEYMSDTMALVFVVVGGGFTLAFLVSVILVAMWIHRGHRNLHEYGLDGLEFTPGWAVGWYFIPFANLVKPFQAMRELWNASTGAGESFSSDAPGFMNAWWGTWLLGNIISNISSSMADSFDASTLQLSAMLGAASGAFTIVSAWLLLRLIREITAGQAQGLGVREVFA